MEPPSSLYTLADKLLDGDLEQTLRTARDNGTPFDAIARDLHAQGVSVTGETVRNWCIRFGIHAPETAA